MTDASEQHRHRCEVRFLIVAARERGREWVRQYLGDKRVAGRQDQLRTDLNAQMKAGNDGKEGVWL